MVFFPSFEYESQVHATWADKGILTSIQQKKHVYREPRSASEVEDVLQKYRDSIIKASNQMDKATHSQRGALLLCVVGGKMSEGINFSDGMGRCVVMVGLPYPSPSDPELIERMRYIDQLPAAEVGVGNSGTAVNGNHVLQRCGQRGREYYDNLCMKAVNQSIGKPIFPTHLHCIETFQFTESKHWLLLHVNHIPLAVQGGRLGILGIMQQFYLLMCVTHRRLCPQGQTLNPQDQLPSCQSGLRRG